MGASLTTWSIEEPSGSLASHHPPANLNQPGPALTRSVVVLGNGDRLADAFRALCEVLPLRLLCVDDAVQLRRALHRNAPIAMACAPSGLGAVSVACAGLKEAAAFDRTMPIMIVTDADPVMLGSIDTVATLSAFARLERYTMPPGVERILAFLARASRRAGRSGLLPIL